VQRKKQRNTLQKAIAPQLFAGYTLLTHFSIKRCGADFMPRWRALINSCAIIVIDPLLAAVKT